MLCPACLALEGTVSLSLVSCWTCVRSRDTEQTVADAASQYQQNKIKKCKLAQQNVQVNALLDDLLLLFENLKLLWVVGAWHLGAVAADARRGCGVQRVNAPIAVYGLGGLCFWALLLWWFLLAWRAKKNMRWDNPEGMSISIIALWRNCLKPSQKVKVFNWNSVVGTNSAWKLKKWVNLKLLWERDFGNWKRKLQHTDQKWPWGRLNDCCWKGGYAHWRYSHAHRTTA